MRNSIAKPALFLILCLLSFFLLGASKQEQDAGALILLIFLPIFDFLGGFGLHLVFTSMFPEFHKRHRATVKSAWVPSLLVGIGAAVILVVLLSSIGQIHSAWGLIIIIFILFLLGLGLQAPAANLGDRIYRDKSDESDMSRARAGWFAYAFVQYIPLIGTVFTVLVAITGMGAFILCLCAKTAGKTDAAQGGPPAEKTG
jgi:uncharacterized membrane protein YhaH (DUF805 family)